jgi:hypothetical protein
MRRFRITLAVAMAAVVYLGFAFAGVLRPTDRYSISAGCCIW